MARHPHNHSPNSTKYLHPGFLGGFQSAFPIFILGIITVFIFRHVFINQEVFFYFDTTSYRYPNIFLFKHFISENQLPLWNPYQLTGIPYLADPATNALSPFNFFLLLFDNLYLGVSLLTVILVFLTASTTYLFLRYLQHSRLASLIGASIFGYSGSVLAATNDLNSLQSIVFIPIIFLLTFRLIKLPSAKLQSILAILITLQFFSGHPFFFYLTLLIVCSFLFIKLPWPKRISVTTSVVLQTFLLSSALLIPFLELTQETFRPTNPNQISFTALEIQDLPRLLIANIYGSLTQGNSWGPDSPLEQGRANTEGFVGVTALILAFIGIKSKPRPYFFLTLALFSLFAAFGPNFPTYKLISHLPLYELFRSHQRALVFYSLAIAALSARGIDQVFKPNRYVHT